MANRTATSVLFGFDFQANAAIVLMLENIKDMTSIRLEGAEDIEINLNDGSCFEVNPKSFLSNFWGSLQYGLCNFFSTDIALIYSVKQLQIFFQTNFLFICFQNWKLCFSFAKRIDVMTARIDDIGAMIRNERLRRGMTQEELGELVGVGKAQISKIESGKGLTIKTITKVLGALGLSASVSLKSEQRIDKRIIGYIVAAINEFAAAHRMTTREASNYLVRFKGVDFLAEHYEAEHLLSFDDSVQDLTRVCHNNGGGIL